MFDFDELDNAEESPVVADMDINLVVIFDVDAGGALQGYQTTTDVQLRCP
jgi:hypothetical protein